MNFRDMVQIPGRNEIINKYIVNDIHGKGRSLIIKTHLNKLTHLTGTTKGHERT